MSNYDTISTETWKLMLPSDWTERETELEGSVYFESSDGSKGVYISTWCFEDDPRPAQDILDSFREIELRSFSKQTDRAWRKVAEQSSKSPDSTVKLQFLDEQCHYSIDCKLVVRLPWLVRSSFHDYNCTEYDASQKFLTPIIESLQIHRDAL